MTETASPEPAHANSADRNGEHDHHDEQTSTQKAPVNGNVEPESDLINEPPEDDVKPVQDEPEADQPAAHETATNGVPHESDNMDGEPPAKRRRIRDVTPDRVPKKPKTISPPWKSVVAEGPTSFTEGGRRKSGRINAVPIELQKGDKRITRRSLNQSSPPKTKYGAANGHGTPAAQSSKKPTPVSKQPPAKAASTKTGPKAGTRSARKSFSEDEVLPFPKLRQRSSPHPTQPDRTPPKPKVAPKTPRPAPAVGTRRSTRNARDSLGDGNDDSTNSPSGRTLPRIKLRVRPPLTTIPIVHRDQIQKRPPLGPTFEEYFERAQEIPVDEGGQLASDDGPRYTEEMAREDALVIMRIEQEAEPGGLLSEEVCQAFEPEPEEEPPRQWAHLDHLTRAMSGFRRLMLMEQQRHRAMAKKLAFACEVEWKRRNPQPKTAEEIELEELEKSRARWRQVNKAVAGTWDNVKTEVNRRRLAEWEAEEQKRVKAALNQAVNMSELKLQARQNRLDTDELSDDLEDEDDEMVSDAEDEGTDSDENQDLDKASEADEDNMSTSDDDDEDKNSLMSDEGLTQEQLREKYSNLPELAVDETDAEKVADGLAEGDDDTSDESIDMDDDLGSSDDMDSDDDDEGEEEEEEDEESEEEQGLLGLFFNKSEMKKIKQEAETTDQAPPEEVGVDGEQEQVVNGDGAEDVEMADAPAPEVGTELISPTGERTMESSKVKPVYDNVDGQLSRPEQQTSLKNLEPTVGHSMAEDVNTQPTAQVNGVLEPATPSAQNDHDSQIDKRELNGSKTPTDAPSADLEGASAQVAVLPNGRNGTSDVGDQEVGDGLVGSVEDVSMLDAPIDSPAPPPKIPEVEVTGAPIGDEQPSPDTDAITNPAGPSRSQSPPTSDTKPSEIDTASSVELLNVQKNDSRSTSPQPGGPKTEIPFLLRGTLREYQHYGLDWLAGLYSNNTNGILADEMGLGKTIQTIALLAHLACNHEVWGPHLVIVPTSVMLNWEMEFKKWCPGFKILTYYGNQEERKRKRQGWSNDDVWNVCITSYQMVIQDQQVFRRRRWHYMVLDEAHNIKNFRSQRWQTLLGFNTRARLLLTGTPLQNNLTELWSLLYFLAPPENGEGGFADLSEFHSWFARPESQILENGREQLDDEARQIIAKLHKVLRPYLLRRLKADVEKQMPAKYEHIEFCRLSKRQRELYDGFLSRNDTRDTLASGNYMSIINCLMQLRKVCNHPDLFVDRPIMTSLRMQRSVASDYEVTESLIRKKLLAVKPMSVVSLDFLNMIPVRHEHLSAPTCDRISQLSSHRIFMDLREAQKTRAQNAYAPLDPVNVKSNIVYLESAARWGRFEELQHIVYLNALRRQQRPIYGQKLIETLTLDTPLRPFKPRPKNPKQILSWCEEDLNTLHHAIPTLEERAQSLEMTITKFSCVTPAVVTRDMNRFLLGHKGVETFEKWDLKLAAPVRKFPFVPKEKPIDPWHVARIRSTIQFPDKRLLQYDCGKLQALDKLLRKLQSGGHRALIFTQMTKMLDILEQFLNIHGHKYLRLDGATKVEQRQILTDRFNHDTRILCFILSTRSGGLGINLTGADTVIFYDQDWNPAMDKQCQDRCHRIGQTRDVHIYRLVSEHTIEANILRKAGQKQMLDDVVIQEGEFTTDYFHKLSIRDVVTNTGAVVANENDVAANAAMDRVLGGGGGGGAGSAAAPDDGVSERVVGRRLEQAEDTEDVAAARVAEKETQQDDADFLEQRPTPGATTPAVASTRQGTPGVDGAPGVGDGDGDVAGKEVEYNAFGDRMRTIDEYMLQSMAAALEGTPLDLPRDKKKSKKKGKDTRKR